jgi:hypothetical protein
MINVDFEVSPISAKRLSPNLIIPQDSSSVFEEQRLAMPAIVFIVMPYPAGSQKGHNPMTEVDTSQGCVMPYALSADRVSRLALGPGKIEISLGEKHPQVTTPRGTA